MTARQIISLCLDAGAAAAAITGVDTVDAAADSMYRRWIASGRAASMDYLAKYDDLRHDPSLLLPGARTMICCAFAYDADGWPRSPLLADYARGDDYHDVLREALAPVAAALEGATPDSQTRICVDTAPLRERYWAVRSGLAIQGMNCHAIVPGIGSKVFLAEILWTGIPDGGVTVPNSNSAEEAASPTSSPATTDEPTAVTCGGCRRCVEACPAGALDGHGGIDARRCLSYLTIEHRGDLPERLTLPGRIYGCDICQDVCPHNSCRPARALAAFAPRPAVMALDAAVIAAMTQPDFSATFRRSAVKRAKLAGLQRNVSRRSSDGAPDGKN